MTDERTSPTSSGRTRLRTVPLPVLLGALLLAGLCALLALNTASAAEELKQRSLADANANASDTEQQLLRDLASRQAPEALASAAAALGLVPNPNPAFLRINADGSVTVLGTPVPASQPVAPATPSSTPSPTASRTAKPSASRTAKPSASGSTRAKPAPSVTPSGTRTPVRTSATPTPHPSRTGGH